MSVDWLLSAVMTAVLVAYFALESSIAARIPGGRLVLLMSFTVVCLAVNAIYWVSSFASNGQITMLLGSIGVVALLVLRELSERGLLPPEAAQKPVLPRTIVISPWTIIILSIALLGAGVAIVQALWGP